VAGPGVALQGAEVGHHLRPERIQVEIAHELEEVPVLLHHDRLVPVLEEVARPAVPAVEGPGVAGEERAHAPGQRARPGPHQEVGVIREQGPGVHREGARVRERREPAEEGLAVRVVGKDHAPFQAAHHHVVEGSGGVEASLARHSGEHSTSI